MIHLVALSLLVFFLEAEGLASRSYDVRRSRFGDYVSAAGDVDADGVPDVLVGAPQYGEHPADLTGAVYVFSGRTGEQVLVYTGSGAPPRSQFDHGDRLGSALAAPGDVDGDGHADILVGTRGGQAGFRDFAGRPGHAVLLSGATGGVIHRLEGRSVGDGFGATVAGAGDVNRDGYPDLIVGAAWRSAAWNSRDGDPNPDYVRVFSGRDGSLLHELEGVVRDGHRDQFGCSVDGAGDLNGDGYADFIVGARARRPEANNDDGATPGTTQDAVVRSGWVGAYSGKDGAELFGTHVDPSAYRGGWAPRSLYGSTVASAGDVNADGTPDLIVAAWMHSACVLSGADGRTLFAMVDRWRYGYDHGFANTIAGLGDVDGDGHDDVAVGCHEMLDASDTYYWCVYSGKDGELVKREAKRGLYVEVAGLGGDCDGDDVPDLLLGFGMQERVEVRSGATWKLIRELRQP